MKHVTTSAFALALALAATGAFAQGSGCGIESGSIRILSNDFPALHAVADAAKTCATGAVTVTANATAENQQVQGPALSVNPAEYTVVMVANDSIVPLLNEGLIRPLDDLVAKYGQDLQPSQLIKINGQVMAIAFMANAQHLTYRKDVLEQAGVEPPKSYEEVLAAAEAIRSKGLMENPLGASNKPGWDLAEEFVNMYLGMGGEFWEPGTANLAITNDKGTAALGMMKSLAGYMAPDNNTYDTNGLSAAYQQGKVAIMNMWGSRAGSLIDPAQARPEVASNTVFAAAPTVGGGTVPATTLWWDGFVISKNVSDADAEASFRAMMRGIAPSTATEHPDDAAWLIKGFQPGPAQVGVIASAQAGARPYPIDPQMGVLHGALGTELADFMAGKETAEQALSDVTEAYTAAAREQGFLKN